MAPYEKANILVNDQVPAFAGVIAHLLEVALRTPAIASKGGTNFEVVVVGESDICAPIASMVVSEEVQFTTFDPIVHKENSLCVVTLTGCCTNALEQAGLIEEPIPVIELKEMMSDGSLLPQSVRRFGHETTEVYKNRKVDGNISEKFEEHESLVDLSGSAFLVAQGVTNLVYALVQSSELEKTLRSE